MSKFISTLLFRFRSSGSLSGSRAGGVLRAALLATALGLAGPAGAASKFWTGAVNGNFATGGNWVGGVAPAAGDDLVFQTGITKLFATNNFSPNRAFNSVLFQGSNYFVRGNALLVTNGISSINPAGPNHIDADVDVRASQPWEASGPLAVLDFNGDINLNANTLTVRANTGDFFFSGVISGAGNLVKTNVGTLRMDGAGNNTYGGFTRFDGGVLELDKFALLPSPATFIAIPGDLTVGDGNGLLLTDVLVLMADDQIADTADVTVKNSGHMDLNGHDDRIASLTMQGGTVDTGAGTLALGGNVTGRADPNVAFINGVLSLGGATRTFDIGNGAAGPDMRINATIVPGTTLFQTAGLTKNGAGVLWLAGANTYNGTTMVNDGQLTVSSDKALGATTTPLGGAAGTVLNREAVLFLDGAKVTNEPLTINSTSAFGALDASGASSWTGTILLNVDTTIGSFNTLLLSGAITGTGGFTKLHAGSLTLAGVNVNTYTGVTTVRDGTLLLDKDSGLAIHGAMSGPLVVGEDELPENSDVVRWLQCCQLPDDTDITINASGLVDLNGFGQNVRNLIFNGGDIDTGAGSILPIGDITVNRNTNSQAIISGRMSVLSSPIINVTGHFFSPDLAINAQLFGAGGITKNGVGEVGLSAANSYSGLTTVNDGLLLVDHSLALGSASGGTVVNSGAVLALRFGVDVPAGETLTLAGTGQSGFGALNSSFGSNSWAGNITLSSNATIAVDAGDFLNLSGAIDGGFDLAKTGAGTLLYSGGKANTYKNTFVEAGVLLLRRTVANVSIPGALTIGDGLGGLNADVVRYGLDNQIADGAAITIASSGLLDLNDRNDTVGTIKGVGRIDLGSGVLRAGADDGTDTYDGLILGTGSLFKLGVGAWTLSGNNTYSGPTTVSAGALVVNGSQPHSPVTVNGTATLKGSGVIGDLFVFGNLRPGESPGILTCSNVAFASQGDFFVELNGPAPGAGYDQLNARGTNQMGGSTLHVAVGAGFAPHEGEDFVILNNDGSEGIVGAFAGQPNGSIVTANGLQFRIRYSAIFENDVVLTLTNTAARLVSATVSGGNGDGAIDGNECDFIQIVITNVTGGALTGVTGSLVSKTPGVSVTSGDSAYPTIPAGGRGANTAPFQFSVGPGFVCGTIVTFDLVVTTPSNGTFSIPVSLPSGAAGPAVRFNNSVVTSIPDNNFVDIPILVSGIATPLKRVTVALHITHTADSDLDISLIGPDGTTVNLSSDNGGTASDYGTDCAGDRNRTTFSDSAATSIAGGSAPFAGSFRPEQALAVFNEKSDAAVNGTWRLRVADDTPGAVGSVRCWSLFLSPTACNDGGGACESCPEDRVIRGMLGVGSLTQTKRLIRDGTNSVCGVNKSCPGATGASGDRFYDAYTFENGESNACVTVSLEGECNVFSAAYTNSYDPSDLCLNYLADAGSSTGSGGTRAYSFQAGPGARFVIVAHAVDAGDGCGYTLRVNGGSCRPRLFVSPIAGNKVALDWSTAAVGYGLEQTHALSDPPQPLWVPTPGAPSISNGRFRVIDLIALPPTNTFYHLRKP